MTLGNSLLAVLVAGLVAGGCQSSRNDRDAKREQDRAMMRLADAEKQRDESKAQVEQLRASLATAEQRYEQARVELDGANKRVQQLTTELAQARAGAANSQQAEKQVELLQNKLKESASRQEASDKTVVALRAQLDEAQRKLSADAAATPDRVGSPGSTQPSMNK